MHRYFARRPHNLFSKLITHYAPAGGVVLDPFCGGGVTLIESLLTQRRVIGYDVNPLATLICENELIDWDIDRVRAAFISLQADVSKRIRNLYIATCSICNASGDAEWFEWTSILTCNACGAEHCSASLKKVGLGAWKCSQCEHRIRFSPTVETEYSLVSQCFACSQCGATAVSKAVRPQERTATQLHDTSLLPIPVAEIPDNNMQRESALFKKGFRYYRDFFTNRNLVANGMLLSAIDALDLEVRRPLLFVFSASLRYTNRMVTRNESWRKQRPLEWHKPGFWVSAEQLETNVWVEFRRRFQTIINAKQSFQQSLPSRPVVSTNPDTVVAGKADVAVVKGSVAHNVLADGSVDAIITDPPYGSYLHYADLSNFWLSWLSFRANAPLGIAPTVEEAVIARKVGFPGAKSAQQYMQLLTEVFKECHRLLKKDGWLVLTFNNREPRAWAALMESIVRAGFRLPQNGVIFQDGVQSYKHTSQSRRVGSVIGDFVYSFRRDGDLTSTVPAVRIPLGDLDSWIIGNTGRLLAEGPLENQQLFRRLYTLIIPAMYAEVMESVENNEDIGAVTTRFNEIDLLDSHRGQRLRQHYSFDGQFWSL
jgi:putative DNA methylase